MSTRHGKTPTPSRRPSVRPPLGLSFRLSLGLLLAGVVALPTSGCQMHRWAYVKISSTPPGATVRSKGLKGAYLLQAKATPAGQFLPCTPIDQKAEVVVEQSHWSYILKKKGYNDEEIFVERSAVTAFCAETQEDAKEKPFVVNGKMMSLTTEKGLRTTVKITSQPPGVSVYDAGTKELVGKTPSKMTFTFYAPYKVPRVLLFRLAGYKTLQRQVHVRSINLHVQMLRLGQKTRPVAPPAKKRKVSPPPRPPVKRRVTPRPTPDAGTGATPRTPARVPPRTPVRRP
jgi:hypothetical protein